MVPLLKPYVSKKQLNELIQLNETPAAKISIKKETATFSEVLYKQLQLRTLDTDSLLASFTSPTPLNLLKLLLFSCTVDPIPQAFLDSHLDLQGST